MTTFLALHWHIEIAGLRIAGLGGVFRGQVWAPPATPSFETQDQYTAQCGQGNRWRGDLPRKHRSSIFPVDYYQFAGQRADILVTHEAPSAHPHGFAAIDELARSLGVNKTFHGHHHDRLDYSAERTRLGFDAFGVGLAESQIRVGRSSAPATLMRHGRDASKIGVELRARRENPSATWCTRPASIPFRFATSGLRPDTPNPCTYNPTWYFLPPVSPPCAGRVKRFKPGQVAGFFFGQFENKSLIYTHIFNYVCIIYSAGKFLPI